MKRIQTQNFLQNKEELWSTFDLLRNYFLNVEQISTHSQIYIKIGNYPFVKDHIFNLFALKYNKPDIKISIIHSFKNIIIDDIDITFYPTEKRKLIYYLPYSNHYIYKINPIKDSKDFFDLTSERMNWKWLVDQLKLTIINLI